MLTAGLDEVGWGCAAGPLISVVVVTQPADFTFFPKGVTDSKKLSPAKREAYFSQLCAAVTDMGLGSVEPEEIDQLSPKWALQECYNRAISELRCKPDLLIVDGTDGMNRVRSYKGQQQVMPKADLHHKQVSIASIIAKVIRDRVMCERSARFKKMGIPSYNWEENKGYFTPDHMQAIEKNGLLFGPGDLYQHRKSYCKKLLGKVHVYGT